MQTQEAIRQFLDNTPYHPPVPGVERSKTRYLFLGLNITEAKRIRQVSYLVGGGKEINTPGLARTNGFLRRCRITPLEKSCVGVPRGMEPDGAEIFDLPETPHTQQSAVFSHANPLVGVTTYPGNELPQILYGSPNIGIGGAQIGIVEIESLIGHEYEAVDLGDGISFDPDIWKIQREIFPDYPNLPTTIYELRELSDKAQSKTGLVGLIAEDISASFELSIAFASDTVEGVHAVMREAGGAGRRYSEVELSFLEQLGIPRQDEEIKRAAEQQRKAAEAQEETMKAIREAVAHNSSGTDLLKAVEMMQQASQADRAAFLEALERMQPKEERKVRTRKSSESVEDE